MLSSLHAAALRTHEALLAFLSFFYLQAAINTPGALASAAAGNL